MKKDQLISEAGTLSREFERDGFVSIPGFFDAEEVAQLQANKERFIREVVPTMPETEAAGKI